MAQSMCSCQLFCQHPNEVAEDAVILCSPPQGLHMILLSRSCLASSPGPPKHGVESGIFSHASDVYSRKEVERT